VRAEMCVHGSLEKERLGEVLPDQTKLQFPT